MRKFLILIFVTSLFVLNGCFFLSQSPEVLIKKNFEGNDIAVLNFNSQGSFMISNVGKLTADKLTDALFLIGDFNVIDRAKVNQAQASLELPGTEFLSSEEIQKLGLKLKASYLIIGTIQEVSKNEYLNTDDEKNIYISFRIISVANTDVVGIATFSDSFDDNPVEKIQEMINNMVEKLIEG